MYVMHESLCEFEQQYQTTSSPNTAIVYAIMPQTA